ncbi:MAG: CBS domain-containing protein [Cyanobacteriota bacterium]
MFQENIDKLTVKDVMKSEKIISVRSNMLAREISVLFAENNISGAPVVDQEDNLVGVISVSDISRSEAILDLKGVLELIFFNASDEIKSQIDNHLSENYSELSCSDIMTPNPIFVEPEDPLREAIKLMVENKIHRVIVVKDNKIAGILSMTDIMNLLIYK